MGKPHGYWACPVISVGQVRPLPAGARLLLNSLLFLGVLVILLPKSYATYGLNEANQAYKGELGEIGIEVLLEVLKDSILDISVFK